MAIPESLKPSLNPASSDWSKKGHLGSEHFSEKNWSPTQPVERVPVGKTQNRRFVRKPLLPQVLEQ